MPTVYTRTVERAIQVAGSGQKLAQFLGYPPAEVLRWSSGEASPPAEVFLVLVDIVAANQLAPAALKNLRQRPGRQTPI
jgi:DNA-binding transcriptional regulator YdaS (Cro superfamily)